MMCPGGLSAPFPKRGFIVSRVDPALGLPCPSEEACLGGSNSGNASNASCGPGHAGNRCAQCTDGNYLLYNQCKQCGMPALIWIFSVALPIIVIVGVLLMLCASLRLCRATAWRCFRWLLFLSGCRGCMDLTTSRQRRAD
jgi:hypothetical protein